MEHKVQPASIQSKTPYRLGIRVTGPNIEGFVEGNSVLHFEAPKPVEGHVGLWTKADAKVYFDKPTLQEHHRKRTALC